MECTCLRQTELPGTSQIFLDLIYHSDRVSDLYPWRPNDRGALAAAAQFDFPDERRAALIGALAPLNAGNSSLQVLAQPGTVAVVTGQQVGLFSGPAYTVYKALTAIKAAQELNAEGIRAVPVFWLATEDHDLAEVDHVWVFDANYQPVKIRMQTGPQESRGAGRPVGGIELDDIPIAQLRSALEGLPFADRAVELIERCYLPGQTLGSAFGRVIKELFAPYGLLLVDPMDPALRAIAAPLMREAVERMPELVDALVERSRELVDRGYHAQVLVDKQTSLAFLLEEDRRIPLRRLNGKFAANENGTYRKFSAADLASRAAALSPNALLRPVIQDYLFPTAAYVGGPAELAYLAQSQVIYQKLLGRQPAAFPRAGFTLLDQRSHKRMARYGVSAGDVFAGERALHDVIAARLVPQTLRHRLDRTRAEVSETLDSLSSELQRLDITLAAALDTSRRKIEYQVAKIARKTANQIIARDQQALRDARSLNGLMFPEKHLQERLYSILPFIAKFGPGLIEELYPAVRLECPDHQLAVIQ
jgi:bacillithiol biosynthesis cysteine-adding enzyme BshC